jgi:prepilin-type N-terminal cleavage/methylation domain-containing protein
MVKGLATRGERVPAGKRGFTIIELSVVLAIMSVIATVVVPDFIALTKNELARQAADQILQAQDAARSFYHTSVQDPDRAISDPAYAVWPGEEIPHTCRINPDRVGTSRTPLQALKNQNLLDDNQTTNRWGNKLVMFMRTPPACPTCVLDAAAAPAFCTMVVGTDIPRGTGPVGEGLDNVIQTYVPGTVCGSNICNGGDPPMPAAGNIRCCAIVPKPGTEAAMQRSMVEEEVLMPTPPP